MMEKIQTRWRRIPYLHSILIWTLAILLLGDWLGGPFFQTDFRLRYSFMCIAVSLISFTHELIYKRKSLRDVQVSLAIFTPVIGLSIWLSFALFDAASSLNFLPLLVGMFLAFGGELYIRKKRRKT